MSQLFLSFNLGKQGYGLPVTSVREINRMGEISELPNVPKYISGVMNLRGKVIPVINLRVRLGQEFVTYTKETCIIVTEIKNSLVGLIVDTVSAVIQLEAAQIETAQAETSHFLQGIGKLENSMVLLLNPESVLSENDLTTLPPDEAAKSAA